MAYFLLFDKQLVHDLIETSYLTKWAMVQDHDRMIIPVFMELPIGTKLSDTFEAFVVIVSFTWEPDYASHL